MNKILKIFLIFLFLIGTIFVLPLKPSDDPGKCKPINRIVGMRYYFFFPAFKDDYPYEFSSDSCYYEFYRGILDASSVMGTNYGRLESLCTYINSKMPVKRWNQCYFRLGIASTYTRRSEITDPGHLLSLNDAKIKFCKGFSGVNFDCVIGVYTGINLAYQNLAHDSTFPIPNNDPFWICKDSSYAEYKLQCTRNIVSYIYSFTNHDHTKAVEILDDVFEFPLERYELKLTYFSSLAFVDEISYDEARQLCVSYKDNETRYSCIEGYATGIVEVKASGTEAAEVVKFCDNPAFTYRESGECIRRGFTEFPVEDLVGNCLKSVPPAYKSICSQVGVDFFVPHWPNQAN